MRGAEAARGPASWRSLSAPTGGLSRLPIRPSSLTVLREHYDLAGLKADVIAGLTVAIVALPLSMAIAIASGVTPERGLYTAIVGGFVVSALGGSRFQIGGRRAPSSCWSRQRSRNMVSTG